MLTVKDKEYQNLLQMQQSTMRAKERELQDLHTRLKQLRV